MLFLSHYIADNDVDLVVEFFVACIGFVEGAGVQCFAVDNVDFDPDYIAIWL